MPLNLSERRRSISRVINRAIEITTSIVATARIVGLICSLNPVNICHGNVFWFVDPTNITTTTSSNEVIKAKRPPVAL